MKKTQGKTPTSRQPEQLLADRAFMRLEEWISTRRFPPGTMVSELQLADELGMGRTPIREALQRLKQIGFVEMHPRRGTLVAATDVRQQLELLEVRRPLEEVVVQAAARRATQDERATLQALGAQIRAAAAQGDRAQYFQTNRQIHEAEVRATHNSSLATIMEGVHAQSRRFWYHHIAEQRVFAEGADLHFMVINAIVAKDSATAVVAVRTLMDFLEGLSRSTLDELAGSPARQ